MLVAEWNGIPLLSGSTVSIIMIIIIRHIVRKYIHKDCTSTCIRIYLCIIIHSCACTVHVHVRNTIVLGSCRGLYNYLL